MWREINKIFNFLSLLLFSNLEHKIHFFHFSLNFFSLLLYFSFFFFVKTLKQCVRRSTKRHIETFILTLLHLAKIVWLIKLLGLTQHILYICCHCWNWLCYHCIHSQIGFSHKMKTLILKFIVHFCRYCNLWEYLFRNTPRRRWEK